MSSLTEKLITYLKKQILNILINNLKRKLRGLIKAAALTIIGYAVIIIGLIFICLGVMKYLSEILHLPLWLFLTTSGITLLSIGIILSLIAYYKLKFW
ncbi:hypothetical protein KEJ50_05300 [Candidatus Bathyarchaeota archaeon]|nr:hypothetical protein [Candidatus Bathyarchaeota archaeon]